MAIRFSFPLTDGRAPTSFTAWGTFDYADAAQGQPTKCKLTLNGNPTEVNIDISRTDGIWTATFTGLTTGIGYTADAFYTDTNGNCVNATQEDGIEVTNMPMPVPLPAPYTPPPPSPPGALAAAVAQAKGAGVAAAVAGLTSEVLCGHPRIITHSGRYPACLKFQKAVAVVRHQASPRRVVSVLPVLASCGTWTVLVPAPADHPGVAYNVSVVWLDRNGQAVTLTSFLL